MGLGPTSSRPWSRRRAVSARSWSDRAIASAEVPGLGLQATAPHRLMQCCRARARAPATMAAATSAQRRMWSGVTAGWKSAKSRRETMGPMRLVAFFPRMGYSKSDTNPSAIRASGPLSKLSLPAASADAAATACMKAPGLGWRSAMTFAISSETPATCMSCDTQVRRTLSCGSFGNVWHRGPATLKREGMRRRRLSVTDWAHCAK
mmetsp:Transcript_114280/g.328299  ORF Transcript_114280/g.328299 Transcript_114280/m.328299 type:complete len:206 (+) Transcript_114280:51-668(+)